MNNTPRTTEIISALSSLDDGTGTLGIIVRQALVDDPGVTVEEVRAIVQEAIADAKAERERDA